MIDTDYNEESFFVRHCYFTGGNDPYKRLKAALKADIDATPGTRSTRRLAAIPEAGERQDRSQGDQRLRRRSHEGLPGVIAMSPRVAPKTLASGRPPDARAGGSISVTGRPVVAGVGSHQRLLSPRASAADLWSSVEGAATNDGVKRLEKLHGTSPDTSAIRRLAAYVHQARQYYDVIASLDPATEPLPAYYFALNLTKAFLTLVDPGVTSSPKVGHGASDASIPGQRYRFTQEYAKISQSGVLRLLASRTGQGFCWPTGERIQIARLAAYLVEGADLYGDAVGTKPKTVPVAATGVRAAATGATKEAWLTVDVARMVLEERGLTARSLLHSSEIFASQFQLVHDAIDVDTYTYESRSPCRSRRRSTLSDRSGRRSMNR